MSDTNPFLNNVDSPAYELPKLVLQLGEPKHDEPLSCDQRHISAAIARHSANALELIIDGIGEIGNLMGLVDGIHEVSVGSVNVLGSLLKHLATEADYLRMTQSDMLYLLKSDGERQTTKTGGKK